MQFVTRSDQFMKEFISLSQALGAENCERILGRSLYCDIFNPVMIATNQIFLLRQAKVRELQLMETFMDDTNHQELKGLRNLSRRCFPVKVSDFRILIGVDSKGETCLANHWGQQSAICKAGFFQPRSSRTLRKRCLDLGAYSWLERQHRLNLSSPIVAGETKFHAIAVPIGRVKKTRH
jgi:hypothetical protein